MFKLVIQDDEGKTTVVPLIRDEITIGRKEGNTIRLTERNVSRRHARILRNNGEVHIEDLGSYNGIRVNNARIAERVSLRVSDQVQIGDYKLYLKAEGVEQVDDANTVPVERMDSTTPTDIVVAISSNQPTQPISVPTAAATGAQLVGNPNRTLVAIADTDPAGRPVATAAAVAALTSLVGYGKLVVLSSNFAGKEFELSRPQMIIGRTDENDIVINHRSISRNHAKLVREPETGRYTISDLQSSNGVRVNGSDYSKVELRRGDVVDLGHVRLRFIEPGEDFVFARDAVITDVPDVGGKRTLLIALALGVIVLVGIGAYFATRSTDPADTRAGSGAGSDVGSNPGSQVAINPPLDAMAVIPETPDASELGSNQQPTKALDRITCLELGSAKKWAKMLECSDELRAVDAASAKEFRATATAESKHQVASENLDEALKAKNYKTARTELEKIAPDSVYRQDAKTRYDDATKNLIADYESRARAAAVKKDCAEVLRLQREADQKGLGAGAHDVTCRDTPIVQRLDCTRTPSDPRCPGAGSAAVVKLDCTRTPTDPRCITAPTCDADALKLKGDDQLNREQNDAALAAFEASMKCRQDPNLFRLAFLSACKSKNAAKAEYYYAKIAPGQLGNIAQICVRNNVPYQ